ncbi:MAG: peroxide stress protein YaaA, partial [Cyanobacteria bacterium P01_A01_bin.83]
MLILISPAKTLDFETPVKIDRFSQPDFLADTEILVKQLRQLSAPEISSLMKISDKLGELNASRYQTWQSDFDHTNAKQALLAFQGDVYQGMNVDSFEQQDFDFAQEHLRILSGLYGILRPLDLIQPYRLEMGTKLAHFKIKDLSASTLYEFWSNKLTDVVNQQLAKLDQKIIVNLASN